MITEIVFEFEKHADTDGTQEVAISVWPQDEDGNMGSSRVGLIDGVRHNFKIIIPRKLVYRFLPFDKKPRVIISSDTFNFQRLSFGGIFESYDQKVQMTLDKLTEYTTRRAREYNYCLKESDVSHWVKEIRVKVE